MRIEIHSKSVEVDQSVRTRVERRIRYAIGRFEEYIHQVSVHLAGGNVARGVSHKRCRIRVTLVHAGDIELEDADVDLDAATTRAAGRLGLVVFGELWRVRESARNSRLGTESRPRGTTRDSR